MTISPASEFSNSSQGAGPLRSTGHLHQDISAWTALRAFACVWVVLFHFDQRFETSLGGAFVANGYLAVDLFFVLSGAVIFHVYGAALADKRFSWRLFLWKRFARLYPVHFVTLIAAVAILYGGAAAGLGQAPEYDLGTVLFANLFALHGFGVLEELTLNYPSWSISAEIAAYALFPVLAYPCLVMPRKVLVGAGVAVFLATIIAVELAPEHIFPSNPRGQKLTSLTYNFSVLRVLPEFLLGLIVCRCLSGVGRLSSRTSMLALGVIIGWMVLCLLTGQDWAFVLAGAALVGLLFIGQFQPPSWIIFLGTISYSVYMVHALVAITLFKGIERVGGYPDNAVPLFWWPIAIVFTLGAGYLMWRFVEEPMRQYLTTPRRTTASKHGRGRPAPEYPRADAFPR